MLRFEDVPEILRLIEAAIEHSCRDQYDARQRRAVYASYAASLFVESMGAFDSLVAEDGGRLVGYAQLDSTNGRVRALFVDGRSQRRGVGRALLSNLEARALRAGRRRLHGAMSTNAVPFYLAAGFRPSAGPEQLIAAGVHIPVLRMEKSLETLLGRDG
jgi:GNAT superfamily N-acetyltransferase